MGYQNRKRTDKTLRSLRYDIKFDIDDLWWDLVRKDWKPSRKYLIEAADFIRVSMKKYVLRMERMEKRLRARNKKKKLGR